MLTHFPTKEEITPVQRTVEVYLDGVFQYNIDNQAQLNNIRVWAVATKNTDRVTIEYLQPNGSYKQITVTEDGDLSEWPAGMLDEAHQALITLFKLRKNNIERRDVEYSI